MYRLKLLVFRWCTSASLERLEQRQHGYVFHVNPLTEKRAMCRNASIPVKKIFGIFLLVSIFISLLVWKQPKELSEKKTDIEKNLTIGIIVILSEGSNETNYQRALGKIINEKKKKRVPDSLRCYSNIHGYKFFLIQDTEYRSVCKQKDKFFRRHCVVAQYLNNFDYLLFLDADMGVVNPRRRIEEFIDDRFDVILYDRFFNAEIAAGAYILKNSQIALDFILGFANYESQLPNSFHGTDNGGLHAYIISKIFPDRYEDFKICLEMYNISQNMDDVFTYENCVRTMMGIGEEFGPYRILRKGTGWVRDFWLTNSLWNPETDFMMHDWKSKDLGRYEKKDLPLRLVANQTVSWFDPTLGAFHLDKCIFGNYTWNHDRNLIVPAAEIRKQLAVYKRKVQRDNFKTLCKMTDMLKM